MRGEQLLPILRVLKRDRCMGGKLDQCRFIVGSEFASFFVDDFEYAEQFTARGSQWHCGERARLIAKLRIDATIDWIALLAMRNTSRLAGAQDFPNHAG